MVNLCVVTGVCTVFFVRILALEKLGAVFNQVSMPLQYTPRKFVIHPDTSSLIVIETDHNAYTEDTKLMRKEQMAEVIILLLHPPSCKIEARHFVGSKL